MTACKPRGRKKKQLTHLSQLPLEGRDSGGIGRDAVPNCPRKRTAPDSISGQREYVVKCSAVRRRVGNISHENITALKLNLSARGSCSSSEPGVRSKTTARKWGGNDNWGWSRIQLNRSLWMPTLAWRGTLLAIIYRQEYREHGCLFDCVVIELRVFMLEFKFDIIWFDSTWVRPLLEQPDWGNEGVAMIFKVRNFSSAMNCWN